MNSYPRYKIGFLIPVFEKAECVEDYVSNINTLCPNSLAIIHVDQNSDEKYFEKIKKIESSYSNCVVFPERIKTGWSNGLLPLTFIKMINWSKKFNCENYYFTASNSLVVNPRLESFVDKHDICYYNPGLTGEENGWWPKISQDKGIFKYYDNKIYLTCFEGMVLKSNIAFKMHDNLIDVLPREPVNYPAEEYWIPTWFIKSGFQVNHHPYCLERWAHLPDENVYKFTLDCKVSGDYIQELIKQKKFEMLENFNIFSLKRVPRVYNDPLRATVRETFGYSNRVF